jgi:polysaccharide pyruvyl transferase WcaK-like protein
MSRPENILILGGDTDGNLGDRAILVSMCHDLLDINPDTTINILSNDPERARNDYGESIQVLRPGISGFIRLCRTAAASDLILCGGGGLIQDDDSLIKVPYWALRLLLMRLLCPRIIGYALGVGPLNARISRLFASLVFACMSQITVRDPAAQAVARAITRKPVDILPDPALLLPGTDGKRGPDLLQAAGVPVGHRPVIGVAPRRWYPPQPRLIPQRIMIRFRKPSFEQSARLVELLARSLGDLVRSHDAFIVCMPSYSLAHEGDEQLCRMLIEALPAGSSGMLRTESPGEYRDACGELDALLGGRMHPTIFAAAAGTPVVGLAYNPKFMGLFELLGKSEAVLDVATFVREQQTRQLTDMIVAALADTTDLQARTGELAARIKCFNRQLMQEAS